MMSDLRNIERQIRSFESLPVGWHFGEGVGATENTVRAAHEVVALMKKKGIEIIEVFPAVDGGILVSGYIEKELWDVSCRPDGTMEIDHEIDDSLVNEQQGLYLHDVKAYLDKLN